MTLKFVNAIYKYQLIIFKTIKLFIQRKWQYDYFMNTIYLVPSNFLNIPFINVSNTHLSIKSNAQIAINVFNSLSTYFFKCCFTFFFFPSYTNKHIHHAHIHNGSGRKLTKYLISITPT